MGGTGGKWSDGGSRDIFGSQLHCPQRTVDQWFDMIPIFKVCAREQGYKGGGGGVVATEGYRNNYQVKLGGDLVGEMDMVEQEWYQIGSGSDGVRWTDVRRCGDRDGKWLGGKRTLWEQHVGIGVGAGTGAGKWLLIRGEGLGISFTMGT